MRHIIFVNDITEKDVNINTAVMQRIINEINERSGIQYFDTLYCPELKPLQPETVKVFFYPFAGHVNGCITGNEMVYSGNIDGLFL